MTGLSIKVEIDEEKFQEMIEKFKKDNPNFVEVVRCKDCKHYNYGDCVAMKYRARNNDWFCADGERKESACDKK